MYGDSKTTRPRTHCQLLHHVADILSSLTSDRRTTRGKLQTTVLLLYLRVTQLVAKYIYVRCKEEFLYSHGINQLRAWRIVYSTVILQISSLGSFIANLSSSECMIVNCNSVSITWTVYYIATIIAHFVQLKYEHFLYCKKPQYNVEDTISMFYLYLE